jgi:glutathione peroxidase
MTAMRALLAALALVLLLLPVGGDMPARAGSASAYDFEFTAIDGAPLPLAAYRGHPMLIVNTASFCGYTPQYEGLEALWTRYRERGLVVIGVPSNDFGAQEPKAEGAIKEFCELNYGVDFPLTAKQVVKGAGAHPLYRWAAEVGGDAARPKWNFHKLLFGPDGRLAAAFPTATEPLSAEITGAVEALLKN